MEVVERRNSAGRYKNQDYARNAKQKRKRDDYKNVKERRKRNVGKRRGRPNLKRSGEKLRRGHQCGRRTGLNMTMAEANVRGLGETGKQILIERWAEKHRVDIMYTESIFGSSNFASSNFASLRSRCELHRF